MYDALTTDRPYRTRMSVEKAISILQKDCSTGKLDGRIVQLLIKELEKEGKYNSH